MNRVSKTHTHSALDSHQYLNPYTQLKRMFTLGKIVDLVQYLNVYVVQVAGALPVIAVGLEQGSTDGGDNRTAHMYTIGTDVLLYYNDVIQQHVILGAMPNPVGFPGFNISNWLCPYSGLPLLNESPHHDFMNLKWRRRNFNGSKPYDLYAGDMGWTNPFGMSMLMGLTAMTMKASETTGLWMFYFGQLLRVAGYNYDFWSSFKEVTSRDDEGENIEIEFSSQYPWEMRGLVTPWGSFTTSGIDKPTYDVATGTDPVVDGKKKEPNQTPLFDDQAPVPRRAIYRGHIGDVEKDQVQALPPDDLVGLVHRRSSDVQFVGLSEVTRHQNGIVEVRSKTGIFLQKDTYIPTLKQLEVPDSPNGDTINDSNTYRFAGQYALHGGSEPKNFQDKSDPFPDGPISCTAVNIFNYLAWLHHKLGFASLYKRKDWKISEEANDPSYTTSIDPVYYTPTTRNFTPTAPKVWNINLDHRPNNKVKYTKSRSCIALNNDGSIHIEDAWGSSITLSEGNIKLSCPGDVIMAVGRNITAMAPNDVYVLGGNNVDISAGRKDVRIKAERNLSMLGANGEEGGGVLIESRNTSTPKFEGVAGSDVMNAGIVLKTSGALNPIALISTDGSIELRGKDVNATATSGSMNLTAPTLISWVKGASITMFGATPTNPTATAIEYHTESIAFFGQTNFFGTMAVSSYFNGSGTFNTSVVARSVGQPGGGTLGDWRAPDSTTSIYQKQGASLQTTANTIGKSINESVNTPGLAFLNKPATIGFSFRTDDQYGLNFSSYFLVEARWQQMYRLSQTDLLYWSEPIVQAPNGVPTMPFPGKRNWRDNSLLLRLDSPLWDPLNGEVYGLDEYTDARATTLLTPTPVPLQDHYVVNVPLT